MRTAAGCAAGLGERPLRVAEFVAPLRARRGRQPTIPDRLLVFISGGRRREHFAVLGYWDGSGSRWSWTRRTSRRRSYPNDLVPDAAIGKCWHRTARRWPRAFQRLHTARCSRGCLGAAQHGPIVDVAGDIASPISHRRMRGISVATRPLESGAPVDGALNSYARAAICLCRGGASGADWRKSAPQAGLGLRVAS